MLRIRRLAAGLVPLIVLACAEERPAPATVAGTPTTGDWGGMT